MWFCITMLLVLLLGLRLLRYTDDYGVESLLYWTIGICVYRMNMEVNKFLSLLFVVSLSLYCYINSNVAIVISPIPNFNSYVTGNKPFLVCLTFGSSFPLGFNNNEHYMFRSSSVPF